MKAASKIPTAMASGTLTKSGSVELRDIEDKRDMQRKQKMRIFGAALDVPNSPERLNLKLGYISHLINSPKTVDTFSDPYDVIRADLKSEPVFLSEDLWAGKMLVDSWLTPRPRVSDLPMLTLHQSTSFLRENGCWDYALKVAHFVKEQVFPCKPVMIGVDHSLTGGVLLALAKEYGNVNVIILDAHFDVLKFTTGEISKGEPETQSGGTQGEITFYECGNFLSCLLEKEIIRPENLWVLGVGEEILRKNKQQPTDRLSSTNTDEVGRWLDKGVHILSKNEVISETISIDLNGPTYVSIDMDVGSLSSVFSARFMNCYGLTLQEFLNLLSQLGRSIKEAGVPLVGLDIMEIDLHFLEAADLMPAKDYTRYIARKALEILLQDELVGKNLKEGVKS